MSQSFSVGEHKAPCLDKELDLGTHMLTGPASFSNMSELFNAVIDQPSIFPTGEQVTASKWLQCGTVSLTQADSSPDCGLTLNGYDEKPVTSFADSDGIYASTTIEIPDGCCYWVNMCIPYQARRTVCEICIDGEEICIDGEPLEVVALEAC